MTATPVPDTFAHYLAAWNELDVDRIADHLAVAVAVDVEFVDPINVTAGVAELGAMIRAARVELPDAEYRLASGIDGHHHRFRYRWEVVVGGEVTVPGMDVVTVDEDGRLRRIDGFFGDFAALPTTFPSPS